MERDSFSIGLFVYFVGFCWNIGGRCKAAVLTLIMFTAPIIVIGNPGNIMRFLPKWCRQSAVRFVLVRSVLIFLVFVFLFL